MTDRQWWRRRRWRAGALLCTAGLLTCAVAAPAAGQPAGGDLIEAVRQAGPESAAAAVTRLLDDGADVNAAEPDGTTALHWAVLRDDQDAVRQLIGAGAHADAANRYGVTPLALAATNGSAALVEALARVIGEPAVIDLVLVEAIDGPSRIKRKAIESRVAAPLRAA